MCDTVADAIRLEYDKIWQDILLSIIIYGDETGWKFNGERYFVWNFGALDAVLFHIAPTRSGVVPEAILQDYDEIVVSDSYSVWDNVGTAHQKCFVHYYRSMNKTLFKNPSAEFSIFFTRLHDLC